MFKINEKIDSAVSAKSNIKSHSVTNSVIKTKHISSVKEISTNPYKKKILTNKVKKQYKILLETL